MTDVKALDDDDAAVAEFYSDWPTERPTVDQSIGAQLRRRRQASWRCPRVECGRRDPWSGSAQ